jgi:very-short-patch-repair endonuclease
MEQRRTDALTERQYGLITRSQAMRVGMTAGAIDHRLRHGIWLRAGRGVYRIAGAPRSPRQRALAAVLAAGDEALLSHGSAASVLGLPGFPVEPLTVTTCRGGRRRTATIRYEESLLTLQHHRRVVDGIPCTTVARTLFDLCGDREVAPGRAARALDTALARRLVTMPALWRVLDDLAEHGRRGTVWMRTLLLERGGRYVPPESELEARFVQLVHRYRLGRPERQVDLGDADQWIGRVDFLWREERVVVEVDGAIHHDGFLDRRADEERDARLTAAGWTVLRFRWRDVVDTPAAVAHSIRRELTALQHATLTPKRAS